MLAQLLDLLHGFIDISNQSMGQLYLVVKASDVVTIFPGQHHSIGSFTGLAQKVSIL
jgi:hypothetical protein